MEAIIGIAMTAEPIPIHGSSDLSHGYRLSVFADYVRFRSVCVPWYSALAAADVLKKQRQYFPYLMLPYCDCCREGDCLSDEVADTCRCDLLSLVENGIFGGAMCSSYMTSSSITTGFCRPGDKDGLFLPEDNFLDVLFYKERLYGVEGQTKARINDLGERMLFLGMNSSFPLSAHDFPVSGCEGNSIYFTHHHSFQDCFFVGKAKGYHIRAFDMCVFNLKDERIQPFPSHSASRFGPPPFWLTPN
ncbi:hypothetical protein NE237_032525 [Protea cynaroides]|uniref:KIB1-4 beta-propeller domain-containing protein n=1 Tax=Protea cynaroides TaxID=273540 RepID=A0A9Q0R363_9MAGN|nr:hypothetical protein NE237_032525 [Protea cynaroides]